MIKLVSQDAIPFVLGFERERQENPTIFYLEPFTAEETALYRARWRQAQEEQGIAATIRARNAIRVDREHLAMKLRKMETVRTVGDTVEGEDVAPVIELLDYVVVQELLLALQSMALLEAGRKKS